MTSWSAKNQVLSQIWLIHLNKLDPSSCTLAVQNESTKVRKSLNALKSNSYSYIQEKLKAVWSKVLNNTSFSCSLSIRRTNF